MREVLASLRKLLFGETWTIPLGVAATVGVALVLREATSVHAWSSAGGFVIGGLVVATLALSLRA